MKTELGLAAPMTPPLSTGVVDKPVVRQQYFTAPPTAILLLLQNSVYTLNSIHMYMHIHEQSRV